MRRIIRCENLALYIRDCVSLCLSDETLKAVGPFYLVSMPGEVKYLNSLELKSQVVLLQTAHSWANAGILLGWRMHQERGSFRNN